MKSRALNLSDPYSDSIAEETPIQKSAKGAFNFHNHFEGCMEMYAAPETVKAYLDAHQGWFRRCAKPMTAEPLGENSYALVIGRFGAFGYEVEPKMGVELLPQQGGTYRMHDIPIPNYTPPGYEVDYQASLQLAEDSQSQTPSGVEMLTRVEWELDLGVTIHFPKFIERLPRRVIQNTGDRLLTQIVRQVSKALTRKVQEDFHASHDLPTPPAKFKW